MFKKFVSGEGKEYIASHLSRSVGLLLEGKVKCRAKEYDRAVKQLVVCFGSCLHELFMNVSTP